jgi:hypothetical protein
MAYLGTFGLTAAELAKLASVMLDTAAAQRQFGADGEDLQGVAKALCKAWAGNVDGLKRLGVALTTTQAAELEAASGAERTRLLAEALEQRFGGLAVAMGERVRIGSSTARAAEAGVNVALGRGCGLR